MKKVILWDKTSLFIKDDQLPALEKKLEGTTKFWLSHAGGRDLLSPSAVYRVTNAGREAPDTVPETHRIEAPPETPEQKARIEANKAKIRKILAEAKKKK